VRAHRLASDVEADAERIGNLPRGLQKFCRAREIAANFEARLSSGIFRRHAKAHTQRQVFRQHAAVGRRGRVTDLFQFFDQIEAEHAHTMLGDQPSTMALGVLTGCIKHSVASGSAARAMRTSATEATS